MEAIINEKAMRGIERFLERRGMEILETGWAHGNDKIDFIARDEDDLAFISCTIRTNEGNGLGAEALDRKMFERIAAAYLAEHLDFPEGAIRHDAVVFNLGQNQWSGRVPRPSSRTRRSARCLGKRARGSRIHQEKAMHE